MRWRRNRRAGRRATPQDRGVFSRRSGRGPRSRARPQACPVSAVLCTRSPSPVCSRPSSVRRPTRSRRWRRRSSAASRSDPRSAPPSHAAFGTMGRAGAVGGAIVVGAWMLSRPLGAARRVAWASSLVAIALLLMILVDIPRWDRDLLSSGAYKYAPYLAAGDAADLEASL